MDIRLGRRLGLEFIQFASVDCRLQHSKFENAHHVKLNLYGTVCAAEQIKLFLFGLNSSWTTGNTHTDQSAILFNISLSCRLCPTYQSISKLPLSSRIYAHKIEPNWPFCTFELRGSCRDTTCRFQMNIDCTLNNVDVLKNVRRMAERCCLIRLHFSYCGCKVCDSSLKIRWRLQTEARYHTWA